MITAAQLRAPRGLLGIDQPGLAELSGLSVPTIQRIECSQTMGRGNVDSLVKRISGVDRAGVGGVLVFGGGEGECLAHDPADGVAVAWRAFPPRRTGLVLPRRRQSGRRGSKSLRSWLRPSRGGAAARAAVLPRLSGGDESC